MKKLLKRIPLSLCSFFLALPVYILFLAGYKVLGPHNNTLIRGDLYAQYIDFIAMFLRVLRGEESFWYSFSLFLGSGAVLTHAYYCLSPFNLLYLLDFISLPAMTSVIIGLKFALAASTFTLFAQKILKRSDVWSLVFALCYAFNSFSVAFYFNMVWLDTLYMLPLAILLLFRLSEGRHFVLHSLCWAYIFLTNFYTAYMAGIFTALVFAAILILQCPAAGRLKYALKQLLCFGASILLAAGLSAAVLLPAALYLLSHMAADNFAFSSLSSTIFNSINSMFIGVMPQTDNTTPLLYCGLPALLLAPFYFFNKRYSVKERLLCAALLLFLIVSLLVLPLFMFWHAFDYPNWYAYRFSFCLSFLLCSLACRVSDSLPRPRILWPYICGLILLYSSMRALWPLTAQGDDITNSAAGLAINAAFLLVWGLVLTKHHRALPPLCLMLAMAELCINMLIVTDHLSGTPLSDADMALAYYPEKNAIDSIKASDKSFYRISVDGESIINAPSLFGYHGYNTFSTSDAYALRTALHSLGISAVNRAIQETGYTDITHMLLGTKYYLTLPASQNTIGDSAAQIKINQYALPLGYMVSKDIENFAPAADPFSNQEQLLRCMSAEQYSFYTHLSDEEVQVYTNNMLMLDIQGYTIFEQFTPLMDVSSVSYGITVSGNELFYASFANETPEANSSTPYLVGKSIGLHETPNLSFSCITQGTDPQEDSDHKSYVSIVLNGSIGGAVENKFFVRYDPARLPDAYASLNSLPMLIEENSGDHIKAQVTATAARPVLFTTIPYDKAWQASVDGQIVEITPAVCDAFISLKLSPGEHSISFDYIPPGRSAGRLISLVSAALLILCAAMEQRLSRPASR